MPCLRRSRWSPAASEGQLAGCGVERTAPDGGGWGLVMVAAASSVTMLTSFTTRCAGLLYFSWQQEFDSSAAQTAAIASIISSMSYFFSAVAGAICNRCGCRFTWILGGLLMLVASVASVWASDILLLYAVGAVLGAGVSLCYLAALVAVAEYFDKYYAIASSVTASGIAVAFVAFPPLLRLLLDTYGWRGTMLITGGVSANICTAGALYRPLQRPGRGSKYLAVSGTADIPPTADVRGRGKCRHFINPIEGLSSALGLDLIRKSYRFLLFCLINAEFTAIYSCSIVLLVAHVQSTGIDQQAAPYILSFLGIGSLCGRLVAGFCVTRRASVEVVYTVTFVFCGMGCFGCALGQSYQAFATAACLLGLGTGANRAMVTVLLRKIVGLPNVATGIGISYFFGGIGDLIGPIIGGSMHDHTGSFQAVFYLFAGISGATLLQMFLLPVLKRMEPGLEDAESAHANERA